jgi:hypothetical protein
MHFVTLLYIAATRSWWQSTKTHREQTNLSSCNQVSGLGNFCWHPDRPRATHQGTNAGTVRIYYLASALLDTTPDKLLHEEVLSFNSKGGSQLSDGQTITPWDILSDHSDAQSENTLSEARAGGPGTAPSHLDSDYLQAFIQRAVFTGPVI